MNFKIPNIPVPNIPVPNIPVPNIPVPKINQISSSLLDEVSNSVPNIITNAAINSIPDITEIVETLFKKFLIEYNLSENMGIAVVIISICTIIIIPNLIVMFYSEYLNINIFYTYLIISAICGVSLFSLKLEKDNRNNVLYINSIIGSIITVYAIYLGANYKYTCAC
jgi:hypothetical protein